MSALNQLLWALIGLLLTILATFIEVFWLNDFPTDWSNPQITTHSLNITSQIGAVLLTGCVGGKNAGAISQIAYIILGLSGMPIFAHGGGLDYLDEPSFGYLLGFIPGAWVCGWLAFQKYRRLEWFGFSSLSGLVTIHLCGLIYLLGLFSWDWLHGNMWGQEVLQSKMIIYSVVPLPGQLALICVVSGLAFLIRFLLFY